jgi:hypothetical protein
MTSAGFEMMKSGAPMSGSRSRSVTTGLIVEFRYE